VQAAHKSRGSNAVAVTPSECKAFDGEPGGEAPEGGSGSPLFRRVSDLSDAKLKTIFSRTLIEHGIMPASQAGGEKPLYSPYGPVTSVGRLENHTH
jgi:hypothetical protein